MRTRESLRKIKIFTEYKLKIRLFKIPFKDPNEQF